MPAILTKEGDALVLDLSTARGLEFKEALEKIRAVPGRQFDFETKMWRVPANSTNVDQIIHSIEPIVSDDLKAWAKAARIKQSEALTTPLPEDADIQHPLGDTLYPYQRAFVDLAARMRSIINADDMGLGKTLQALAVAAEWRTREGVDDGTGLVMPDGPKLIACPNSVKGVWAREIVKWLGSDEPHQIIDAASPAARHKQLVTAIREDAWSIVNYEQFRVQKEAVEIKHRNGSKSKKTVEMLKQPLFEVPFLAAASPSLEDLDYRTVERARKSKHRTNWLIAVADEAHRIKNRRAAQTKGFHRIKADLKLAQTGTPMMNTPDELWSLLHWLFPAEYTSFHDFYETYVEYTEGYFGKVITGVKNPDALRFELRNRLVRRTKDQVLDLPDKTRVIVPVTLTAKERKFYDEVLKQVWLDLKNDAAGNDVLAHAVAAGDLSGLIKIPNGAARLVRLQQVLEHPSNIEAEVRSDDSSKMDACEEIILDNKHTQHVCFLKFKQSVAVFAERLRAKGLTVGVYTGDVDSKARTRLEDEFQAGDIDVMVGTLDAMREGITLTSARTEHFLTRAWVPGWNEQAEDRCHRVGQSWPVTIYIYEAEDTVDDGKVRPANERKSQMVATVLEKDAIQEERRT